MKISKSQRRQRRSGKSRHHIARLRATRLTVHRTSQHIYAQVIAPDDGKVLASASSVEAEVRKEIKHGGNIAAAEAVGKRIAEKAKAAGVERVAFDRSGFQYHGRIKALADAARENGLQF